MGHPDGDLQQSPEKSCLLNKQANDQGVSNVDIIRTNIAANSENRIDVNKQNDSSSSSSGTSEKIEDRTRSGGGSTSGGDSAAGINRKLVCSERVNDKKGVADVANGRDVALSESDIQYQQHHRHQPEFPHPESAIHSHQDDHHYHPHVTFAGNSDTVKNISEESGLSSGGDVSSSLSSSESFSGSEEISGKSCERDRATTGRSGEDGAEPRCQKGIDVIVKQQEKLEQKRGDDDGEYELDCGGNGRREENNKDGQDDGDQHGFGREGIEVVVAWPECSSNCDTTTTSVHTVVDEGVEISCSSTRGARLVRSGVSSCNKGNSNIVKETRMMGHSGEEEVFDGKAAGEGGRETSCQTELSSNPPPVSGDGNVTDGKSGNHAENIWTFPSVETAPSSSSSSSSPSTTGAGGGLESETREKQQSHHQQNRDSRPQVREKRRVFGLSGFGCRFNLNKIFSSSASSSSGGTASQRAATHLSTERLNNQLSVFPSESQGAQGFSMGTTTLLSNVSKSSSESNILMCHNSLDNLTDELPSSRSTDSSCLLPTTAVDDQVLDHRHLFHQPDNILGKGCCCCCGCCCCRSNGTCDHPSGQSAKCIGHNSNITISNISGRCSSSPATVGRQRKGGNVNSDGKEEEDGFTEGENVSLPQETNNNNHRVDLENRSNPFTGGNRSNSADGNKSSCNPSFVPACSSSSSSIDRETVLRTGAGGGGGGGGDDDEEEGDMAEEMNRTTACGSSASHSNRNRNGDGANANCIANNCSGACTTTTTKGESDPEKCRNGTAAMTGGSRLVNSLGENSATCSSLSPTSSSASPSCSTASRNSCISGRSSESKGSGSSNGDDNSCSSSSGGTSSSHPTNSSHGQKFKLLSDGDVQVCRVKHGKNLVDKVIGSKLLRRWETHHLYLNDACISSKTPIGPMAAAVPYWQMEEVYVCVRLDSKRRYVIRIVIPDGSLLLQGSNAYVRDQWYYSILWKKNIYKYQNLMRSSKRPEVILKELKSLVNFATTTPLQDDCISHVPIEIVSNLLDSAGELLGKNQAEEVLVALSPLLERSHPPPSLCRFFSRYCRSRPRCPLVAQLFTPVVRRALKHNVDFGKHPYMRLFIQEYIQALNCHNDGVNVVRNFVKSIHGPASSCPHPRVMSNLVSVCLAAMFQLFEKKINKSPSASAAYMESTQPKEIPYDEQLICYLAIFDTISEFEDWRPSLAQLLQPIPFPDEALNNPLFTRSLSPIVRRIGTDHRCDVHQMVLGIRDGKEGWFHLFAPSSSSCFDDGELWGAMLGRLLTCCCRRKRFLSQLGGKLLGSSMLLALRENAAAQEALCLVLEWQLVQSDDQRVQIATTLQSTPTGSANYLALCNRQLHLKELQQKGGPRKLTLPSRSTDKDLAKLLSCGSFGNLECLSLAFTQVTSACAEQLIKLPSLRYLNLWCTQFGDPGLQIISEHLPNLQVLNLCETPVTDKGLLSLTCMTSLRKLNLNSTHLSALTFERLKKQLPALKEIDVRYTDAW